jgi:hypothetical protein
LEHSLMRLPFPSYRERILHVMCMRVMSNNTTLLFKLSFVFVIIKYRKNLLFLCASCSVVDRSHSNAIFLIHFFTFLPYTTT